MEIFIPCIKVASTFLWAFLVAQRLKRLPPMLETQVRSLGREDPLEKEMVTHSSILAWRIPWTEKPGRLQPTGSQKSDMTERLHLSFLIIIIFFFFLLYNIVLVLPYINMHPPRVYMCSPSWTPLPSPSPYHPSGSSQCTSPESFSYVFFF